MLLQSKPIENYKKSRKELKLILTDLRKWIEKNYGKRCGEVGNGCFCCIAWSVYDLLEVYFEK